MKIIFLIVVNFKLGSGCSSVECVNADVDFNYLTPVDQQQQQQQQQQQSLTWHCDGTFRIFKIKSFIQSHN